MLGSPYADDPLELFTRRYPQLAVEQLSVGIKLSDGLADVSFAEVGQDRKT
ncbi:MAG: hypothetical protein ACRDTH_02205 [Pseudonocardiaceae bacterium]